MRQRSASPQFSNERGQGENRKLRVLWISFDFPPRLSSGVFRTIKLYKYLDKNSFDVDFITHGEARRLRQATKDDSLTADLQPVPRVVRIPTPILHDFLPSLMRPFRRERAVGSPRPTRGKQPRSERAVPDESTDARPQSVRNRMYRRFAMLFYFPDHLFIWGWLAALTSLWLHAWNRYDVVYTSSYPESAHLPGIVLKAIGVKWIADYRYGGPLWIKKVVGYSKSPRRERVDRGYQQYVLRRADEIITQSEPLRDDFCSAFSLDRSRVCAIPNGYDERDFDRDHPSFVPFVKQAHEIHLLHVGAMEGLMPVERRQLVEALNRLADDLRRSGRELVLRAVGNDLFREDGQTRRFTYCYDGVVGHHRVPPHLRAADCLLLSTITTSAGGDAIKGFIPGKLWEYLRAEKPILMVGPKDAVWKIIDDADVGLHLGLNGDGAFSGDTLIDRITARRSLHPNVREYSWEFRAHSFQTVLRRVATAAADGGHTPELHA